MATFIGDNPQKSDKANEFKRIRKKIKKSFDSLIQKVTERRDALLQQLTEWEQNDVDEMKSSKQEMEQLFVTLESEKAKKSLQKTIDDLTKKISDYENTTGISFACETNELEWRISQLGMFTTAKKSDINEILVRRYNSIEKPLLCFGTQGNGNKQFSQPRGVLVDEDNKRVFITDYNHRIQVWSMNGQYLSKFGERTLDFPWEIALHNKFLYVSDFYSHFVSKWCSNTLKFIGKSKTTRGPNHGQLVHTAGIAIDSGEVFVVESGNKRISVFDLKLRFKRVMADQLIDSVNCLRIRSDIIYIAEKTGVIKLITKTNQLVRTIDRSDIFSDSVCHFNFDSALNFLVTDVSNNFLYILSPEGEFIHSICFDSWGVEDPFSIDVTRNGNIVISFQFGSAAVIIC